ncbi:MAG: hypothetical protein ACR2LG_03960 [Actinomycetota bacterium]
MNEQVFERIDAKLGALLAISVDQYLRETGIARPKPRSIDKILNDVGLTPQDIAALLGKTERAVYKVLEGKKKTQGRKSDKRRTPEQEQGSTNEGAA